MAAVDEFPFISVIIPVYNDAEKLRGCLECLAAQTYPRDRMEAVVVDNGSRESPRGMVQQYSFCRFAEEPTPGSYAARNRGVDLSQGEVLAFTDADCLPQPEWLAAGVKCLQSHPECGFVGGSIEVFPTDVSSPTAVELFDMVFGLDQRANIERTKFAVTANFFTRRETFDRVGAFDATLKSGGDSDWGHRATALGLPGRFCDQAVVRHPARRRREDLVRQIRRHAGGRFDRHRKHPYRYASLHFWLTLVNSLIPDVRRMVRARRGLKERGFGVTSWFKVAGVILVVQYARTWEFIRKWLGAESERT